MTLWEGTVKTKEGKIFKRILFVKFEFKSRNLSIKLFFRIFTVSKLFFAKKNETRQIGVVQNEPH